MGQCKDIYAHGNYARILQYKSSITLQFDYTIAFADDDHIRHAYE